MKDLPFTVLIVALVLAFLVWSDIQERRRNEAPASPTSNPAGLSLRNDS